MTLPNTHFDENVLFDWRGSARWTVDMEQHVATCPACATRLEDWEEASNQVRSFLRTAAAPDAAVADHARRFARLASPRPRRLRLGLVAAVVPLGFLILFSVAPVRAWVVEQWRAIVTRSPAKTDQPPAPAADGTPTSTVILSFVPAGDRFTVGFDHVQPDGVVTLRSGPGREASVRVLAPRGDNVLVTGSGIRVRNTVESRASFLVTVPPRVAAVIVSVGGVTVRTVSREEMAAADVPVSLQVP